jgi:hypothetical protein
LKIGVSGHQNMPHSAVTFVEHRLMRLLTERRVTLGVSSLAKGADQLFAEALLAQAIPLRVILPCRHYAQSFDDPVARDNYHHLLSRASTVEQLEFATPGEKAFIAAGYRIVDEVDLLIAIWDGMPARGCGGTADIVAYAISRSRQVTVLWPQGVNR